MELNFKGVKRIAKVCFFFVKKFYFSSFSSTLVTLLVDPDHDTPVVRVVRQLGLSGSAANAGASTQSFNQGGGGFGHPGFGGGLSGSASQAGACEHLKMFY